MICLYFLLAALLSYIWSVHDPISDLISKRQLNYFDYNTSIILANAFVLKVLGSLGTQGESISTGKQV